MDCFEILHLAIFPTPTTPSSAIQLASFSSLSLSPPPKQFPREKKEKKILFSLLASICIFLSCFKHFLTGAVLPLLRLMTHIYENFNKKYMHIFRPNLCKSVKRNAERCDQILCGLFVLVSILITRVSLLLPRRIPLSPFFSFLSGIIFSFLVPEK